MMVPRSDVTKVTYQAQVYRNSERLWADLGLPWNTADEARVFVDRWTKDRELDDKWADWVPGRRVLRVETVTQTAIIYRSDD